ncbi:hypothetical protein ASPCADRAFT_171098, partial [Aspergillus carbonarius ITEM 5010]
MSLSKVHSAPSTPQKAIQHASINILPGIPFRPINNRQRKKLVPFPFKLVRFPSSIFGCKSVRACPVALGSFIVDLRIYRPVLSLMGTDSGIIITRDSVAGWEGKAEAKVDHAR